MAKDWQKRKVSERLSELGQGLPNLNPTLHRVVRAAAQQCGPVHASATLAYQRRSCSLWRPYAA